MAEPRLAAALMGMLVKGLGADRIVWGTDAVWTGAPQWQIEGLRRLEIPEDMQKKYGFKPLGPADGPVKNAVFGGNSARLYGLDDSTPSWPGTTASPRSRADYQAERPRPQQSALWLCREAGLRRAAFAPIAV